MTKAFDEAGTGDTAGLIVLSSAPDEAVGKSIATALVERRLAACVNLLPGATSVYRWQGSLEEAREVLMIVKTTRDRVAALEQAFCELHPYDTPEFVVLEPEHVAPRYSAWLERETR